MIKEINLFRTFLYEYYIPDDLSGVEKELEKFNFKQPTDDNETYNIFSSTDKQVLNKLSNLKNHIYFFCKHYMKEVLCYANEPEILSSWIVKTLPNGRSNSHIHENSLFTGVFYPQHNPKMSIRIYNPVKKYLAGEVLKYSPLNSDFYDHIPNKNTLIMFNSNLEHRINTNLSDDIRYSLAFTVHARGDFGNSEENMCSIRKINDI
jgi:hypothetical protein